MIKHYFIAVAAMVCTLCAAASDRDLADRLKAIDAEAFKMAVADMQKLSPQFKPADGWQQALATVEAERKALVAGIAAVDKASIAKATKLLGILDGVLLSNPLLAGREVVVIRRNIEDARGRMGDGIGLAPTNFTNNSEIWNPKKGWDNEIVALGNLGGKLTERRLYKPADSTIVSDIELHFSGDRLMYSSVGTSDRWHLFELDLKSGKTKQLTPETYLDFDSFDGCYTPDGKYIFCSTATFLGLPCTNGGNKMCGLFLYDPVSGRTRQLTFDQDSNWGPVVTSSGKILYQRWEYADLPHSNSRYMFTMNPDGTSQTAYYGSGSYFPTAYFGARPIPGHSTTMVGTVSGHHSVTRSGRLMIIDPMKGRKEAAGVVAEIPYRGRNVEALVRDRLPDGVWPHFVQPFALNDTYFLVSMKRTPTSLWGVYMVDTFNNMTLICEQEGAAIVEPTLLASTKTPPVIPDRINLESKTATIFLQDVYVGDGLKGIPRGTVKKLRIGSFSFSPLQQGGLLGTIGIDGPWDIKRILGEVDVEADGSAMFTVPANTAIFVQPLDSEGKALQVMRSWFTAMPGETLSCIGCHEDQSTAPVPRMNQASKKAPQPITEFYGKARGVSFVHEVQPILDRACVACHDGSKADRPYFKGDKQLVDWRSDISGAMWERGGNFTESYFQLSRYVRRPGIESDIAMLAPMDVHADQTELFRILNNGHHGAKLTDDEVRKLACWIDFNTPFHGRRADIPSYPATLESYANRAKYLPMLGLEPENLEYLPELQPSVIAPAPKSVVAPLGDTTTIKGWPHYAGEAINRYTADNQIALGQYQRSIDLGGGLKLHLIKVPAGTFRMGSADGANEHPMSVQTIDRPFWIGRFEITNSQFALFDPMHDSRTEHRHGYQFGRRGYPLNEPDQPVVRVSWSEAMKYCQWLSEKTGLTVSLPTEAEWEWACRSGSDTPYHFGGMGADFSKYANMGDVTLREFAACTAFKNYESWRVIDGANRYDDWIPRDTTYTDGGFVSRPVGSYRPNAWDIYDMHGNVSEWTRSSYRSYPYTDADGRNSGDVAENKVVRGGSWYDRPAKNTAAYRNSYRPYQGVFDVGFRVVVYDDEL